MEREHEIEKVVLCPKFKAQKLSQNDSAANRAFCAEEETRAHSRGCRRVENPSFSGRKWNLLR